MTSEKQLAANRRNAEKSTGPRTSEGKAIVARNALQHGLLAQDALLPGEDAGELAMMSERLAEELQPEGELEQMLVERVVGAMWRLRRLGRIETGLLVWEYYDQLEARARARGRPSAPLIELLGVDGPPDEEELRKADEAQARQETDIATLGRAFAEDARGANAFSKLSRYETAIERSLFRALHELQRMQAARRGEAVAAPVAVDVDVTVDGGGGGSQ